MQILTSLHMQTYITYYYNYEIVKCAVVMHVSTHSHALTSLLCHRVIQINQQLSPPHMYITIEIYSNSTV